MDEDVKKAAIEDLKKLGAEFVDTLTTYRIILYLLSNCSS